MAYKKKLYTLNPLKNKEKTVETHVTKRKIESIKVTPQINETNFREHLAKKISGTLIGIWLLIPEHLRLGTWDLLKGWTGCSDIDIKPRMAMQLVHESALCVNRVRPKNSLTHQCLELANGLPFLVTDEDIHYLLNEHTISEAKTMQLTLGKLRNTNGHFNGDLIAIDPHRIVTTSKRIMPKKKKVPNEPSKKVLQTFFSVNAHTGQPLCFTIGSSGQTATRATYDLIEMNNQIIQRSSLIVADKEHFTSDLLEHVKKNKQTDILVPVPVTNKLERTISGLNYQTIWAGYALAETTYQLEKGKETFRLIIQRSGEIESQYKYVAFITTSDKSAVDLLTENYKDRWTIEDFFNFDGAMGLDRASTLNLNIRYGKLSLGLIAQAVVYQFRQKLPKPYIRWNAEHVAKSIFSGIDGDLRVKNDTIIVTLYNVPKELNLQKHYENLPQKLAAEGINSKVPWLYDFKVDFRFK